MLSIHPSLDVKGGGVWGDGEVGADTLRSGYALESSAESAKALRFSDDSESVRRLVSARKSSRVLFAL